GDQCPAPRGESVVTIRPPLQRRASPRRGESALTPQDPTDSATIRRPILEPSATGPQEPVPRPGSQRGAARLTIGPVGRAARSACTLESQRPRAPPGPDALAGSRNGAGPWRVSMRVALRLLAVLVAGLLVASAWGQQSPATQPATPDV